MKLVKKLFLIIAISALVISMFAPLATVRAQTALFSVTIIAPGNANLLRRQWAQLFATNLQQLGIDARVVYLPWTSVYDRALTPASDMVGKTWDQGGWDILALGWTPGVLPDPRPLYYGGDPAFFAPTGQNYYLWNNPQSNALLDQWITSTDETEKSSTLTQWQQLYYNEVPASQIIYQAAPVVVNPHIQNLYNPVTGAGEGWLYFNAQPYPQLLKRDDGKTQVVYCSTGSIDAINPPESDSWYDVIVDTPIFDGLAETWPTLNATAGDLHVPALLTSWSQSADGFTWTFNCRQGVQWQDGTKFTADDVVFSLWTLMNADTGSQFVGYYQSVFGNNVKFTFTDGTSKTIGNGTRIGSITATDANTVTATIPALTAGKPYAHVDPDVISFANNIIPKHIFENIAPADWSTSVFNTGQGSQTINGVTYTGPVGTGPYKWVSYDPTAQVVHLQRFDNYWNATGLESAGLFQIKDYYIRFISDSTSALAALKNGEVDMLDYNYNMQTQVGSVDPSWGKVIALQGVGRQEFGYNMQSPIFGTGVDTPLGKQDPSRAAEAARDIRVAFDYAIPRQLIIDNLLAGFGNAGATPMLPTQPYYDNAITARPYDLTLAAQSLAAAGYSVPSSHVTGVTSTITIGGAVSFAGYYKDPSGAPITNRLVQLMETTDNATYTNSTHILAEATTDLNGFYSFTTAPASIDTHYYYLFDSQTSAGSEFTYLGNVAVTAAAAPASTVDLTPVYVIAAVAIVLSIVAIVIALWKRK